MKLCRRERVKKVVFDPSLDVPEDSSAAAPPGRPAKQKAVRGGSKEGSHRSSSSKVPATTKKKSGSKEDSPQASSSKAPTTTTKKPAAKQSLRQAIPTDFYHATIMDEVVRVLTKTHAEISVATPKVKASPFNINNNESRKKRQRSSGLETKRKRKKTSKETIDKSKSVSENYVSRKSRSKASPKHRKRLALQGSSILLTIGTEPTLSKSSGKAKVQSQCEQKSKTHQFLNRKRVCAIEEFDNEVTTVSPRKKKPKRRRSLDRVDSLLAVLETADATTPKKKRVQNSQHVEQLDQMKSPEKQSVSAFELTDAATPEERAITVEKSQPNRQTEQLHQIESREKRSEGDQGKCIVSEDSKKAKRKKKRRTGFKNKIGMLVRSTPVSKRRPTKPKAVASGKRASGKMRRKSKSEIARAGLYSKRAAATSVPAKGSVPIADQASSSGGDQADVNDEQSAQVPAAENATQVEMDKRRAFVSDTQSPKEQFHTDQDYRASNSLQTQASSLRTQSIYTDITGTPEHQEMPQSEDEVIPICHQSPASQDKPVDQPNRILDTNGEKNEVDRAEVEPEDINQSREKQSTRRGSPDDSVAEGAKVGLGEVGPEAIRPRAPSEGDAVAGEQNYEHSEKLQRRGGHQPQKSDIQTKTAQPKPPSNQHDKELQSANDAPTSAMPPKDLSRRVLPLLRQNDRATQTTQSRNIPADVKHDNMNNSDDEQPNMRSNSGIVEKQAAPADATKQMHVAPAATRTKLAVATARRSSRQRIPTDFYHSWIDSSHRSTQKHQLTNVALRNTSFTKSRKPTIADMDNVRIPDQANTKRGGNANESDEQLSPAQVAGSAMQMDPNEGNAIVSDAKSAKGQVNMEHDGFAPNSLQAQSSFDNLNTNGGDDEEANDVLLENKPKQRRSLDRVDPLLGPLELTDAASRKRAKTVEAITPKQDAEHVYRSKSPENRSDSDRGTSCVSGDLKRKPERKEKRQNGFKNKTGKLVRSVPMSKRRPTKPKTLVSQRTNRNTRSKSIADIGRDGFHSKGVATESIPAKSNAPIANQTNANGGGNANPIDEQFAQARMTGNATHVETNKGEAIASDTQLMKDQSEENEATETNKGEAIANEADLTKDQSDEVALTCGQSPVSQDAPDYQPERSSSRSEEQTDTNISEENRPSMRSHAGIKEKQGAPVDTAKQKQAAPAEVKTKLAVSPARRPSRQNIPPDFYLARTDSIHQCSQTHQAAAIPLKYSISKNVTKNNAEEVVKNQTMPGTTSKPEQSSLDASESKDVTRPVRRSLRPSLPTDFYHARLEWSSQKATQMHQAKVIESAQSVQAAEGPTITGKSGKAPVKPPKQETSLSKRSGRSQLEDKGSTRVKSASKTAKSKRSGGSQLGDERTKRAKSVSSPRDRKTPISKRSGRSQSEDKKTNMAKSAPCPPRSNGKTTKRAKSASCSTNVSNGSTHSRAPKGSPGAHKVARIWHRNVNKKDCGRCLVCRRGANCGRCEPCLNMVEFGGGESLGAKCVLRICLTPILTKVPPRDTKATRSIDHGSSAGALLAPVEQAPSASVAERSSSPTCDSEVESLSDHESRRVDDLSDLEWEDGYEIPSMKNSLHC